MRRGLLLLLLAGVAACQARYQDGEWRCDASNGCPDGFRCGGPPEDRRCFLPDHGFTLTLLVTGTGQGELRNGSATLISGFTRTFGVDFGERVTLVATPVAGSGFFGWTGPCAAVGREPTCTLDVDADATVEARFEPILQVDVATTPDFLVPEFTGGVACAPDVATCRLVMLGETAVVTVPPPASGSFGGWANAPCGGRTPCSFTPTSTLPITLGVVANPGAVPAGATTLGTSGGRTQIVALASDADGNLYATGTFEGTLVLGPATLTSAGKRDVFVARLAPDRGSVTWASAFGSAEDDDPTAITLDPADASAPIWVAGTFRGNLAVMLGGTPTAVAYGGGANDGFLAGFDRGTGGMTRLSQLGDTGTARPRAISDAIGPGAAHVVVVAGEQSGPLRWNVIGGAAGAPLGSAPTDTNAFLLQALPDGTLQSSLFRGAAGDDSATALDANGVNVYVGGYYATPFDGLPAANVRDAFLLRYDAAAGTIGNHFGLGGGGNDEVSAVAVRVVGGTPVVWGAGTFEGTALVEGATPITADGVGELFLVKLDAGLGAVSASVHGGEVGDRINDLVLDAAGNLTLAGTFANPITFGGRSLNDLGTDAFLVEIDPSRAVLSLHAFGSAGAQRGRGVVLRGDGAIMAGSFDGSFASGRAEATAATVGIEDAFLVEVGP